MSNKAQASEPGVANNAAVSRSVFKGVLGSLFSLLTGLASQVVVAWLFGAGVGMDAFLTALVVPTYLWIVSVYGLVFVFVPLFVKEEVGSEDVAWGLVGTIFWLTTIFLMIIAVAGFLFAPQIIAITAPGMSADKADLTTRMLSVLIFTVPFLGLGTLTESIQNARGSFFWPATARALGSVGNVIVLLLLYRSVGPMALAWGNLVSALLAASVPAFPVLHHGWTRLVPLTDHRIREMAVLLIPLLLLELVNNSTLLFERYFASVLSDGSLSYLGYAYKISNMLVTVLAAGIAAAILPAMARAYAQRGESALAEQSQYAFRLTLATSLPAITLLSVVATPLVTILFERGAFDHQATVNVSRIVLAVLLGDVVFRMLGNVISRTFYILKNTYTYPLIHALSIGLYIIIGKIMADNWSYVGLAVALPIKTGICVLVALIFLSWRLRFLFSQKLLRDMLIYAVASLMAAPVAWLLTHMLSPLSVFLGLAVPLLGASFLYVLLLLWLDREMAESVIEIVGLGHIVRWMRVRLRRSSEATRYRP